MTARTMGLSEPAGRFRWTGQHCPVCETDLEEDKNGSIVKDEKLGEKFCVECGTTMTVETFRAFGEDDGDQWERWWDHRAAHYDGFRREGADDERIKFVGSFSKPWDFEEDL